LFCRLSIDDTNDFSECADAIAELKVPDSLNPRIMAWNCDKVEHT